MKTILPALLLCAALLAPVASRAAAQDKAAPEKDNATKVPEEIQFVPSTFTDAAGDPKFGKDVFFPLSKRFIRKVETPDSNPAVRENQILAQLTLKGISGKANKRLAVVNTRTVAQGESWELKVNGQTHHIRCEEIKARSVVLSIEGFPDKKELQLRGGL